MRQKRSKMRRHNICLNCERDYSEHNPKTDDCDQRINSVYDEADGRIVIQLYEGTDAGTVKAIISAIEKAAIVKYIEIE